MDTGTVLAGRWVLAQRIGSGASSRVYLAKDLKLDIAVAVKVLHESLAGDESFISQFSEEANSVSVLEHDHIVRFYDAGTHMVDDLEVPWIATAFMGGGSLQSMLDVGRRLSVAQAVAVGRDAARALTVAHEAGIVHRDVKPANLLFDDTGRVALADFGIARAIAAAASTEPIGAVSGTTRYASPEQMQGRAVDGRSDVYSLALVLMESVTGVVPMLADTVAGTVAMRSDSSIDVSVDFGVLREPLLAATETDPWRRCTAADLVSQLNSAVERVGPAQPLDLVALDVSDEDTSELRVGRGAAGVTVLGAVGEVGDDVERSERADDAEPTSGHGESDPDPGEAPGGGSGQGAAAGGAADDDLLIDLSASSAAALAAADDLEPSGEWRADSIAAADEHARLTDAVPSRLGPVEPLDAASAPGSMQEPDRLAKRSRRPALRKVLLVALLVALLAGAGVAGWWFFIRIPTHVVPAWVGDDVAVATEAAEGNGWEVESVQLERRDGTVAGEVLAQQPEPGTELAEGEAVSLTVSEGQTLTAVPALAGVPEADAVAALEAAGLLLGTRSSDFNEDNPAGIVLLFGPAEGSEAPDAEGRLPKGTAIDVFVSDGPAPRTVPGGIVGATRAEAVGAIEGVQLVAEVSTEYSDTVDEGIVISVGVAEGTQVPRDSAVQIVVSDGPRPIIVPNVVGRTGSSAAAALEEAGFTVSGIEGSPTGTVLATDPVAGEARPPGSSVRIFTRQ